MRHPHTIQERRAAGKRIVDGYPVKVRPARNVRNLPSDWDDFSVEEVRSWKKYRKQQHR